MTSHNDHNDDDDDVNVDSNEINFPVKYIQQLKKEESRATNTTEAFLKLFILRCN